MKISNITLLTLVGIFFLVSIAEASLSSFWARDIDNVTLTQYHIDYLPKGKYKKALEFMEQYMDCDDPSSHRKKWTNVLNRGMSVYCHKEGSNKIIGVALLFIKDKSKTRVYQPADRDYDPEATTVETLIMDDMQDAVNSVIQFNVFEKYNTEKYLASEGLAVDPNYRRRSIGEQLVRIRGRVCHDHDVAVTSTVFINNASNSMARKLGFQFDATTSYEEIFEKYPQYDLTGMVSKELTRRTFDFRQG